MRRPFVPEWVHWPVGDIGRLVTFMREQLGKPIPSPVVLGQVTEKFRDSVKAMAERQQIPFYQFDHKERKYDVANKIRQQRGIRDGIVFIGVAQEKVQAFQGKFEDHQGNVMILHELLDGLHESACYRLHCVGGKASVNTQKRPLR